MSKADGTQIGAVRRMRSVAARRYFDRRSVDLTGDVYGDLTVLRFAGFFRKRSGKLVRVWECRCRCTRKKLVSVEDLRSGNTKSCGCRKRKVDRAVAREVEIDAHAARLDPGFWLAFSEILAVRNLDVRTLRLRWPGTAPAFREIFEKRRRVPDEAEALAIAEMCVLRGFDRDGFVRMCFEARLARERARDALEREAEGRRSGVRAFGSEGAR